METTFTGATSAPAVNESATPKKKSTPRPRPDLKLVTLRRRSTLTMECYWARLLADKKSVTVFKNRDKIQGIQVRNPAEFFELDVLDRDCLLRENAAYCPGVAGTISHTYLGDRETLCLDSSYPDDLKTLVFKHRRSDLDPPPAPAA